MANRSYLYTVDKVPAKGKPNPKPIRSLSEWGWDIPLSHKILACVKPKRCQSAIWKEHEIGIAADFHGGRDRLLALLEVLTKAKPKKPKEYKLARDETVQVLKGKKYDGKYALLECGEIFDMLEGDLVKHADALVEKELPAILKRVDAAIAGGEDKWVAKLAKSWEKDLGLYWADVLYFDFG